MAAPDQSEVIGFLADPETHAGAPVDRIDTHCAHVFLAGDRAWKIKRAVRYDYLDFSDLPKRKSVLERELDLNRAAAPTIYRRVLPVTRDEGGKLEIGGGGEPVEYVLEMARFPAECQLDRVAAAGGLSDQLAQELGAVISDYHARAPVIGADGAELVGEILAELSGAFAGMRADLGDDAASFVAGSGALFARLSGLLSQRGRTGHVRRCHSDLHLANLVLIDGRPVPFDALEFDERLGTCDTLYDLAFLVMDLLHRRHDRAANLCFNAYVTRSRGHGALALLPLFLGMRAAIRAMVEVQTASATGNPVRIIEARSYLADACSFLAPPAPRLVAIGGVSGTGKTSIARDLAPGIGAAPGALHLRTDVARKALFGVPPTARLSDDAYAAGVSRQVYDGLLTEAAAALRAGHSAILDATFLDPDERTGARDLARDIGIPFTGIWLTAPEEVLAARVARRAGDASDATPEVVHAQLLRDPGPVDWSVVDARGSREPTRARVAEVISGS